MFEKVINISWKQTEQGGQAVRDDIKKTYTEASGYAEKQINQQKEMQSELDKLIVRHQKLGEQIKYAYSPEYAERLAKKYRAVGEEVRILETQVKAANGEIGNMGKIGAQAHQVFASFTQGMFPMLMFGGIAGITMQAGQWVKDFVSDSIDAFISLQKTVQTLTFSVTNIAKEGSYQVEKLKKQAEQLNATTRFGYQEVMRAQAMLIGQFKLSTAQVSQLMPKLADMAAQTGKSIEEISETLGQALAGRMQEINKDYGLVLINTGTVTGNLNEFMDQIGKYAGSAAKDVKTLAGEIQHLKNVADEAKEDTGTWLSNVWNWISTIGQMKSPADYRVEGAKQYEQAHQDLYNYELDLYSHLPQAERAKYVARFASAVAAEQQQNAEARAKHFDALGVSKEDQKKDFYQTMWISDQQEQNEFKAMFNQKLLDEMENMAQAKESTANTKILSMMKQMKWTSVMIYAWLQGDGASTPEPLFSQIKQYADQLAKKEKKQAAGKLPKEKKAEDIPKEVEEEGKRIAEKQTWLPFSTTTAGVKPQDVGEAEGFFTGGQTQADKNTANRGAADKYKDDLATEAEIYRKVMEGLAEGNSAPFKRFHKQLLMSGTLSDEEKAKMVRSWDGFKNTVLDAFKTLTIAIAGELTKQNDKIKEANDYRISQYQKLLDSQTALANEGFRSNIAALTYNRDQLTKQNDILANRNQNLNSLSTLLSGLGVYAEQGGIIGEPMPKIKRRRHPGGGDILLHAQTGEGVLNRKEMANLGKDNFYRLKKSLLRPVDEPTIVATGSVVVETGVTSRLDAIEKAIKEKPVQLLDVDADNNRIETLIKNGMRETVKHIQKPIRL